MIHASPSVSTQVSWIFSSKLDRWWARALVGLFARWLAVASFVSLGLVLAIWKLFLSGNLR